MDHEKLVQAARMILEAIGEDTRREGLAETPERMARMYEEVFEGLEKDPDPEVKTVFTEEYDEIVLVKECQDYAEIATLLTRGQASGVLVRCFE